MIYPIIYELFEEFDTPENSKNRLDYEEFVDILSQRFSESVDISVGIPLDLVDKFKVLFDNITRGKCIYRLDNIYHGVEKTKF